MIPRDANIRIHRSDGTHINAKAMPCLGVVPVVVHESPEKAVLKTLFTWDNSKGERVAECFAEDFKAVEIVP